MDEQREQTLISQNYNIGVSYECLEGLVNVKNYYKKGGEYIPACVRLKELLRK